MEETSPEEPVISERIKKFTKEEDLQMCTFLHSFTFDPEENIVEKFRGSCPSSKMFWMTFIEQTGSTREAKSLSARYSKIIKKLPIIPVNMEMKLNLYYSLSIPIPADFVETAMREANISMDENRNIEAFEMKSAEQMQQEEENKVKKITKRKSVAPKNRNGPTPKKSRTSTIGNELENEMKTPGQRKSFTVEEDMKIWQFLYDKIKDPVTKVVVSAFKPHSKSLWTEFAAREGIQRSPVTLGNHFKKMIDNLHKIPLSTEMKTDLYYGLSIPVNMEFLQLIRQKTNVEVDENNCIVKYNSNE